MNMTLTPYERKLKATLPPEHWNAYCDGVLKVMVKREEAREAKALKNEKRRKEFAAFFTKASTGNATGNRRKMFHSFSTLNGGSPSRVISHAA